MTQCTDILGESVLASELCKGSIMITAIHSLKQATDTASHSFSETYKQLVSQPGLKLSSGLANTVMRESPLHQPFNTLNLVTFH
jgi:hypothetical protein